MESEKTVKRIRRHWRVRRKVSGTADRPRLSVFRSNRYVYAQLIDDVAGKTLAAASSLQKTVKGQLGGKDKNKAAAVLVGKTIATRALEKGIKRVCFDRGGYRYHGRVKALADAAREAGLEL